MTTRINEHLINYCLFSEIVTKCNNSIDSFIISRKSRIFFKKLFEKTFPIEIIDLIDSFSQEKLDGEEISWIIKKSLISLPFECILCSSLMKLKFKQINSCFWNNSIIYKDSFCTKCTNIV